MATLEDLTGLYEQYEATTEQVRKNASAFAGVFGLGDDPRKHSCHDKFFDAVENWSADFLQSGPSQEEVAEAVRFILEAAHKNREKETYWYFFAVQGHVRPLIPLLSEEACRQLRDFYNEAYPAVDRPPVQREVYKLLQQYSGQKVASGSFLQRLFGKK